MEKILLEGRLIEFPPKEHGSLHEIDVCDIGRSCVYTTAQSRVAPTREGSSDLPIHFDEYSRSVSLRNTSYPLMKSTYVRVYKSILIALPPTSVTHIFLLNPIGFRDITEAT